jgi:hypothetical protein
MVCVSNKEAGKFEAALHRAHTQFFGDATHLAREQLGTNRSFEQFEYSIETYISVYLFPPTVFK